MAEQGFYQLSTDYRKLYLLVCEGHRVAGWADTYNMHDEHGKPYRDICEIRRTGEYEILISARGISYGSVFPFMKEDGTEEEVFVKHCKGCSLRWIDPTPLPG